MSGWGGEYFQRRGGVEAVIFSFGAGGGRRRSQGYLYVSTQCQE
jgi:hypothetical protein